MHDQRVYAGSDAVDAHQFRLNSDWDLQATVIKVRAKH